MAAEPKPKPKRRPAPPIVVDVDGQLGFDPLAAVEHLRQRDRVLGRFIDGAEPFALTLDPTQSIFLALAEAIVYQQLTGKAAATIFGRVRALFPAAADGMSAAAILAASD